MRGHAPPGEPTDEGLSAVLEARFGSAPEFPESLEQHAALRQIARHSSHRAFTAAGIDEPPLQALFGAAFSAPSKSDLQQASVVRLVEPDQRAAIAALVPQFGWAAAAPEFLVWCGDNRRSRRLCALRGKPFANDHLDSFMNAAVDTALVMMNFIRAAEAVGLGCCPVSVIRDRATEVRQILALPAWVFPVAGLAVGWPARRAPLRRRLSLAATVHTDRYDDSALPQLLDEYDRRRDAVHPIGATAQRDPARFGEATLYGWSEDKARQLSSPERDEFGRFIREQGFRLD